MVGLAILKIFQHAITITSRVAMKKMLIPIRYNKGSERKKHRRRDGKRTEQSSPL